MFGAIKHAEDPSDGVLLVDCSGNRGPSHWNLWLGEFSVSQQESLASYSEAKLTEQIGMTKYPELDSWLCFASYFWPQWNECLVTIKQTPNALISLYEVHSTALQRGNLGDSFWKESPGKELLIEWFSSSGVQDEILVAYALKKP